MLQCFAVEDAAVRAAAGSLWTALDRFGRATLAWIRSLVRTLGDRLIGVDHGGVAVAGRVFRVAEPAPGLGAGRCEPVLASCGEDAVVFGSMVGKRCRPAGIGGRRRQSSQSEQTQLYAQRSFQEDGALLWVLLHRRLRADLVWFGGAQTSHEALVAIPALLDEMWVSPLVALVDCVDPIARSAGLALLSRIVQRGEGERRGFSKRGGC
jgi:hypothetical protein